MQKTLNVGIAGYGVVGRRRRQCIDAHPRMTVTAVCDQVMDGDGTFDDGVRYYRHYSRLLDNENLDVLFVSLTNDIAPEVTIAALKKGLHVFCEKPPGRNVDDIRRVIAVEKTKPALKLKYGFNHRYHNSVRDALELVRSKELGRVINLNGMYGKSKIITFGQTDWRTRRAVAGGGVLLDQGIHMVDLLRLFAGEFKTVHSFVSSDFWGFDVEDNAYALMRTEDGVVAMLHSSATQWRHRFRLDIALERGALSLSGILSGSKSYGAETLTIARRAESPEGDPKEQTTHYDHDPSWQDEVNEFAGAIADGSPITSGSSLDALHTMELVYRVYCADPAWRDKWDLTV